MAGVLQEQEAARHDLFAAQAAQVLADANMTLVSTPTH
jgi:hypothetical protein